MTHSKPAPASASQLCTLTNLRIWDGHTIREGDTLQFRNGRITFLGSKEEMAPTDQAIDCAGLTAIPGLIDAHVHMELNPNDKSPPEKTQPSVIPLMRERAAHMAAVGITTARDLGGGAWLELALRDDINLGAITGPRLLCSGQPITSPRGHCHFWGGEAHDLASALTVLQRQVTKGVDLIKIMATGGRLTKGSDPTLAQFPQLTMDTLVATAHEHNLPVAAHCHGTEGILRAALAGVDTIEHCSWAGADGWASDYQDDIAKIVLHNGVWVSPTVNQGWQRMLDNQNGQALARIRAAYRKMSAINIPMAAGTDAGIPGVFHADLPQALLVFAQIAELSAQATLKAATSDAATALGISHITGSLQTGKSADILLLDGDPTEDLSAVTRAAEVYCAGRRASLKHQET